MNESKINPGLLAVIDRNLATTCGADLWQRWTSAPSSGFRAMNAIELTSK